jgi:shikimate dehydrogenase
MSKSVASRLYAVVGDPVLHSLSPLIHNRWIKDAGLDAHYSMIHLQAEDAAPGLRLLAGEYSGLNITLPHKIAALAAATGASREARTIGAANTLARQADGSWFAHNTDVAGFSEAFREATGGKTAGPRVILIGAGGAARAAVASLGRLGVTLTIVNRSKANAQALADDLGLSAEIAGLDDLSILAKDTDIIVNSASLGHSGASLPHLPAGKGRPFLDLSYGKAAAPALAAAQTAGWTPHDGLTMLVAQAAAAFEIWFGISPDFKDARASCREVVAARR